MVTKSEADAHDKVLDAAYEIAELIQRCGAVGIDEPDLDALALYLAQNAFLVRAILQAVRPGR